MLCVYAGIFHLLALGPYVALIRRRVSSHSHVLSNLEEFARRRHIKRHDLKSLSLLVHGLDDGRVRLLQERAEIGLSPLLSVSGSPEGADGRSLSDHLLLEHWVTDLVRQIREESSLQVATSEPHVAESESQVDVLVKLNQIPDGEPESVESILDNIDTEASAGGDRNGVGVDGSITLLVDRVLADSRGDLFLALVADQVVLKARVNNEDGLHVVDVLPLSTLLEDVHVGADATASDLGQLSLHVEREAAEALDVDALTSTDVCLEILKQCLPNNQVLGLRLDRLQIDSVRSHRRTVVLARVLRPILEDPIL